MRYRYHRPAPREEIAAAIPAVRWGTALTAIALLFAILKLKPTAFCILDEIEAALDEANVSNFASYVRNYSANTQFILITHRKGSMEVCDSLYGVAMEEKGVSKVVSARFASVGG